VPAEAGVLVFITGTLAIASTRGGLDAPVSIVSIGGFWRPDVIDLSGLPWTESAPVIKPMP